jgi:hypothetical protein
MKIKSNCVAKYKKKLIISYPIAEAGGESNAFFGRPLPLFSTVKVGALDVGCDL